MLCFLTKGSSLSGAAPITHAYLTKSFFYHFSKYTAAEENEFMVGTLFPDIRYLGDVTRHDTHCHCEDICLQQVLDEPDPFTAGVKFHCYVDIVREKLLVQDGLYDKIRKNIPTNTSTFVKLAEDEILYQEKNWSDVLVALTTIYPQEREYDVPEKSIVKWHKVLTMLFSSSPSFSLNMLSLSGKGIAGVTSTEIQHWNHHLRPMTRGSPKSDWLWKKAKWLKPAKKGFYPHDKFWQMVKYFKPEPADSTIYNWVWKMVKHFEDEFELLTP